METDHPSIRGNLYYLNLQLEHQQLDLKMIKEEESLALDLRAVLPKSIYFTLFATYMVRIISVNAFMVKVVSTDVIGHVIG